MIDENVIRIASLSKSYATGNGETIHALDEVALNVRANDFICIVGPSGCGKSTLLRIIAGLEQASGGSVHYRDTMLTGPSREIGMVFQEYSLLPWRNVLDNVGLGMEFAGAPGSERLRVSRSFLKLVGMERFERAFPHELSGGMQQRVAIARSLANNPDVSAHGRAFRGAGRSHPDSAPKRIAQDMGKEPQDHSLRDPQRGRSHIPRGSHRRDVRPSRENT